MPLEEQETCRGVRPQRSPSPGCALSEEPSTSDKGGWGCTGMLTPCSFTDHQGREVHVSPGLLIMKAKPRIRGRYSCRRQRNPRSPRGAQGLSPELCPLRGSLDAEGPLRARPHAGLLKEASRAPGASEGLTVRRCLSPASFARIRSICFFWMLSEFSRNFLSAINSFSALAMSICSHRGSEGWVGVPGRG